MAWGAEGEAFIGERVEEGVFVGDVDEGGYSGAGLGLI